MSTISRVSPGSGRRARLQIHPLAALIVLASCTRSVPGPEGVQGRTLTLEAEPAGVSAPKPFSVVFGGPRGEVVDPSEVSIVWNRPVRALDLAGQEAAVPVTITKADGTTPKGAWRWMGTSGVVFAPSPALPRATELTVTVPAGTKALDGSVLAEPYSFQFSTPRPKLVRGAPSDGSGPIKPNAAFELRFNQPVDPHEVERAAKLLVGDPSREVPFHALWPKPAIKTFVKLVPSAPLPLASSVQLAIDASLRGMEGPLPVGQETTLAARTYGPLAATGIECWRETPNHQCDRNSVRVELTNAVPCKDLAAHLSISPPTPLSWACEEDEPSASVSLPASLAPAKHYVVTISAGLKDVYGQRLGAAASLPFETDDEWPRTSIYLEGSVFEADVGKLPGRARVVPIGSVNTASYDLLTVPLDEAALIRYLTRPRERAQSDWDVAAALPTATIVAVQPRGPKNERAFKEVSLDEVLAKAKGRGAALVGIRVPEHRPDRGEEGPATDVRVVSVTDLGITGRMSRFGSVVWVSRLSDGKPVAGATVAVRREEGGEIFHTKTDDHGIALISAKQYEPVSANGEADPSALVFARSGDDWAYTRVAAMVGGWADLGKVAPIGMLFTERGVYKPGETVKVKGLFRQPRARSVVTPAGRAVHLIAFDGAGEKVFAAEAKLDPFGGFALDVPLPATAHMGTSELRAELAAGDDDPDAGAGVATASVLLAAYRPAEFKVGVDPDKTAYVRGDKASFSVAGDYLFGAPMSGGDVHFTVTRAPGRFVPPGAADLVTDDGLFAADYSSASPRGGEVASGRGALNDKGTLSKKTTLPMPGHHGAELVTFEAEVEDVTRQTIAGRASVIVHPGEFYVALKAPEDTFVATGTKLHPEVLALEPSGAKRSGVPVHVELVHRTWSTVLEATSDSSGHYESRTVDKVIASCDVATGDALAGCDLPVTEAGYLLLHATAKDGRNNPLAASSGVYALADGADLGWPMSDASTVDLVPDKRSYELGDTAKVLVKSPFREAEALVTVERAGVYHQEWTTLRGGAPTLSIPITDEMRPNAYVSVELVHGRAEAAPSKGADGGGPGYRTGAVSLRINPEARRLTVGVTSSKKDYAPGDEVAADVQVSDREGKGVRASVTFYAVDEGVLMLTGYTTPDPIPAFTAPRSTNVYGLESRAELARLLVRADDGTGLDKGDNGGGGGSDAPSVRKDFRATAYFEPSLQTGADGKAHVRFKLPDGLTTYRLMAVAAAEDDRFGSGEAQVTTSRPLMARPALPRFLRAGDTIEAGVVVTSKGLPAAQVEVAIAITGGAITGDAKRLVSVPANGSVEVRWPIATPASGRAELTFTVKAGEAHDEVKIARDVEVPLSPEAVALYGETRATGKTEAVERLGDLGAMRSDVGGLDIHLASTALVGLDDGVASLIDYPYGCTEQLTSRLVPLVPLVSLAKDYGVELPPNLDRVVDETVAKILKNQQDDGTFGWWSDSPRGDDWLTAYALWGLQVAKRSGHQVPDAAIERATSAVRESLSRWEQVPASRITGAFVLDVLATSGSPDPGYTNQLYDKRADLPLFARALLAHAIVGAKMDKKQAGELLRDVESHLRVTPTGATVTENVGDEYASLMDSEARTTALVLRALVAMDPKHPLAARVAKGLLGMRHGGAWRSPQETAWALLALDDYRHAQEGEAPDFEAKVTLHDRSLLVAPFHERSVHAASATVSAADLLATPAADGALGFQLDGTGTLFYEARLRYARRQMPTDALDRGFSVRKVVRSIRPEALRRALATVPDVTATEAKAGDMVLVDLIVVTPDPREQVVIDDPLPAGLEAVDANLATTGRAAAGMEAQGAEDDARGNGDDDDARANGNATNDSWYHREIHDDRVVTFVEHMAAGMYHYRYLARATTLGAFVVPPTRVECMYEPETFGRTAGGTFAVKARP